ncbi:uncharacterized protein LOC141594886 [Silene latifolia]|uniref:uncharacterized protein LOC141594886 n=1 Tax=Silene latifolia TaxID=37657 RepID=UPI003D781D8B
MEVFVDASRMGTTISRFNPTTYEGTCEPKLLDNWHREMESVLEVVNCPDDMKVEQAVFYLRVESGVWWHREKEAAREYYKSIGELAIPWAEFKKELRNHFIPEHIRSKLRAEFDTFDMTDSVTLAEYYHNFNELSHNTEDIELSQLSLALRFEMGLSRKIMEKLCAGVISDLKEVYERERDILRGWLTCPRRPKKRKVRKERLRVKVVTSQASSVVTTTRLELILVGLALMGDLNLGEEVVGV